MTRARYICLILVVLAITGNYVIGSDISSGVTPQTHPDITDHSLTAHDSGTGHGVGGGGHNGSEEHENGTEHESEHGEHAGVHVAAWNFAYVSQYLIFCLFILAVGLLKILFHKAECLTNYIPESCVLIVFGTAVGAILQYGISPNTNIISVDDLALEPKMFMLILLPPIVLDSAYSLNDRVFADNIGTILLYAVLGTILNWFMIGPLLYGLAYSGVLGEISINFVQCLLFASFIVAVDPVAVLAIFQEVGVNNVLYFLVFGESLLNDAVTVVLYNMMKAFNDMTVIPVVQMLLGFASFFTVSLGGLAIGIIFGALTALLTRTTHNCRIVEPLVLLVMAYLSYLGAELFHWSGIISMIGCGIMQAQYAFHNIAEKSLTTVNYFVKMLSSLSDAVIFLFLGLEVIRTHHEWHTGFVISALALCLICRLITVFGLTWLCNRHGRVKIISLEEQFIMWYGGLRGAVCFALCATLSDKFEFKNLFLTTTLLIVFFTVFVQGITIKPLVSLLKITRKHGDESHSLAVEFQSNVSAHVTQGVECIIGSQSGNDFKKKNCPQCNVLYKWMKAELEAATTAIDATTCKLVMEEPTSLTINSEEVLSKQIELAECYSSMSSCLQGFGRQAWINLINDKYLRYWLQNNPMTKEEQFLEMYQKIAIRDHVNHIYEATAQLVKTTDSYDDDDDDESCSEDEASCNSSHTTVDRPFSIFKINRDLPILSMGDTYDDKIDHKKKTPVDRNLGKEELFGILGDSYNQNFSKGVDREIGGHKKDMIAKLKQKHERLKENKRLRTPTSSPRGSLVRRRKSTVSSLTEDEKEVIKGYNNHHGHDGHNGHGHHGHHGHHNHHGHGHKHNNIAGSDDVSSAAQHAIYNIEAEPRTIGETDEQPPPYGSAATGGNVRSRPISAVSASSQASNGRHSARGATNQAFVDDSSQQHKTVIAITSENPFTTVVNGNGHTQTKL